MQFRRACEAKRVVARALRDCAPVCICIRHVSSRAPRAHRSMPACPTYCNRFKESIELLMYGFLVCTEWRVVNSARDVKMRARVHAHVHVQSIGGAYSDPL